MTFLMTLALLTTATTQDYEQKKANKLMAPFLSRAPWIIDYKEALEKSEKEGKPIFAYFTRSYAP